MERGPRPTQSPHLFMEIQKFWAQGTHCHRLPLSKEMAKSQVTKREHVFSLFLGLLGFFGWLIYLFFFCNCASGTVWKYAHHWLNSVPLRSVTYFYFSKKRNCTLVILNSSWLEMLNFSPMFEDVSQFSTIAGYELASGNLAESAILAFHLACSSYFCCFSLPRCVILDA